MKYVGSIESRTIKHKIVVFVCHEDKNKGIKVNNMWVSHTKSRNI